MDTHITISDQAQHYLFLQRGNIAHLAGSKWKKAYNHYLNETLDQITSCVYKCETVMDIGSGIGGIDVLVARYFGARVVMIDGEDDASLVVRQDQTFCSRKAVDKFMADNKVENYLYMSPGSLLPVKSDLIMSFGSWCFHYPPKWYLDYVLSCCKTNTRLLIDLRKDRPEWLEDLRSAFRLRRVVGEYNKISRTLFVVK